MLGWYTASGGVSECVVMVASVQALLESGELEEMRKTVYINELLCDQKKDLLREGSPG